MAQTSFLFTLTALPLFQDAEPSAPDGQRAIAMFVSSVARRALAAGATTTLAIAASASDVDSLADRSARLRRMSTRTQSYREGQTVSIVRVPQYIAGVVDVGHITLLVSDPSSGGGNETLASVGYYPKGFRSGLSLGSLVLGDEGILCSPDPLYAKAMADPQLRSKIETLHRGTLSGAQAGLLNDWTRDEGDGSLNLTRFTTSKGEARERAIITLDGKQYAGWAGVLAGAENCATFVERTFPGCVRCTAGIPRFCTALAPAVFHGEDARPHQPCERC